MSHDAFINIIAIAALVSGIAGILFLAYFALDQAFPRMHSGYGIVIKKRPPYPKAAVTMKFSIRPGSCEKLDISILKRVGTLVVSKETARMIRIGDRILVRYSIGRLSRKLFIHEIQEDTP